jgi:hypothetical protein
VSAVAIEVHAARDATRWFYVWMAGACALIAIGGFAPTYWLQLPAGTFVGSPLLHLHGLLFSAWTLFFLMQTTLVATGRAARHRVWGLLGISLATAMVLVAFAAADEVLERRLAAGFGDHARAFHIVSTSMAALFGVLVCAAIAYIPRPEIHKRLMLLATITILPPAIARVFYVVNVGMAAGMRPGLAGPRTVESVMTSAIIADLLIVAAMAYDWRTRGRVHPAYLIGGALIAAVQVLRLPVSTTQWWYDLADFMVRFSG